MKKLIFGGVTCFAGASMALAFVVIRQEPIIRAQVTVEGIALGGLTRPEAAKKLRVWWESERQTRFPIYFSRDAKPLTELSATQLGVRFDDQATVEALPVHNLIDSGKELLGQEFEPFTGKPVLREQPIDWTQLRKLYRSIAPAAKPATVRYEKGAILKTVEVPTTELDTTAGPEQVMPAVLASLIDGQPKPIWLTTKAAEKQLPDEALESIREVVSSYTTYFPASQTDRNTNIRLAGTKLDGHLLRPGEKFSFNTVVGERTAKAGYREAGVYRQGRHDTGIGGGICQVSSTLYNAVLFANLAVKRRSNHSIPVAYVPVGRDATVSFPALDFQFENSTPGLIAISSEVMKDRITFRVLGTKVPGLTVKVTQADHETWDRGQQLVVDPTLKPGQRKVIDKGSRRHRITTTRWVYQDGKLVKKEPLGRSNYIGGPKIIGIAATERPAAPWTSGSQGSQPNRPEM